MSIDIKALQSLVYPRVEQTVSPNDAIFYALSIGLGTSPLDPHHLQYVYERGQVAFPTLASVICKLRSLSDFPQLGIAKSTVVHGEFGLRLHAGVPIGVPLAAWGKVTDVVGGKPGSHLKVYSDRFIVEAETDRLIATIRSMTLVRGAGGEAPSAYAGPVRVLPTRQPDDVVTLPTATNQALMFRLNGDANPLHADPAFATKAGFEKPILHGLCSLGIAARAIIESDKSEESGQLTSVSARFSGPLFPGESLAVQIWRDGNDLQFRALAQERGTTVLDFGHGQLEPAT